MIEVVRALPVRTLSHSAIDTYLKCPEKFRRRYIEGDFEPRSPAMVLGSACGKAWSTNWRQKIETEVDLPVEDVLDAYSDGFDETLEEQETAWESERDVAKTKDKGAIVVANYVKSTAPRVIPEATERRVEMHWEGADWSFVGHLDVETKQDGIVDTKVKGKNMSLADLEGDLQPTSYLMLRESEGRPAKSFEFHVNTVPAAGPMVKIEKAMRTAQQIRAFERRVLGVAAEIHWRAENDHWQGAPPSGWWCSEKWCGFWFDCPMGGGA
jgi:hypothetical protein